MSGVIQITTTSLRWMIRADLDAVLSIAKESFENPWSREEFRIALRQSNCAAMVAERNEEVVGYMVYELHKTSIELLNFAVRGRSCRLGVGTVMIDRLKSKVDYQKRNRIVLEIKERNLGGQLFFRQAGFVCTSVLHGWYADTEDAAYRFEYIKRGGNGDVS